MCPTLWTIVTQKPNVSHSIDYGYPKTNAPLSLDNSNPQNLMYPSLWTIVIPKPNAPDSLDKGYHKT